jgi:membrane protein DedA with SNARE-associated domain
VEAVVGQIVALIKTNQIWAGPVVAALTFGESLVLIGVLLPGTAVLVIAGGLMGAGVIDPVPVLIGAVIGAVLGDALSYYLGVWLGRRVLHQWPLNRYREQAARARLFFRRYGIATVFVGRFFGPVRSAVPLVAGMLGMDWRRFQIANVASALIWAPVVLSPGWLFAKGSANLIEMSEADWLGLIALVLAVVTLATVIGVSLLRRSTARRRPRPAVRPNPAE